MATILNGDHFVFFFKWINGDIHIRRTYTKYVPNMAPICTKSGVILQFLSSDLQWMAAIFENGGHFGFFSFVKRLLPYGKSTLIVFAKFGDNMNRIKCQSTVVITNLRIMAAILKNGGHIGFSKWLTAVFATEGCNLRLHKIWCLYHKVKDSPEFRC